MSILEFIFIFSMCCFILSVFVFILFNGCSYIFLRIALVMQNNKIHSKELARRMRQGGDDPIKGFFEDLKKESEKGEENG